MTDIVNRLRYLSNTSASVTHNTMREAADEIERLRKERDELQREVDRLYDDKFSSDGGLRWSRE